MDPVLSGFRPLTPSQRRVCKYFLAVAALLLVQIAAGTIMAHSYYDRTSFYGYDVNRLFPFNFLRDVHIQAPIVWIGLSWIGAALFLAPAIAGGQEAKGQHWLVDLLFWVTLFVVAGALIGDYLGIMGMIDQNWFWFGNQGLWLGRFWQIGFVIGLALVGGPSLGRAVLRVLRRRDERLSADGGRAGLAQARGAGDLF